MNVFNSLALCAGLVALVQQSIAADTTLKAVDRVVLRRYAGKWYEIARYPNRFQRDCESDTTAEYSLRNDGKVQVINACRKKDGTITTARGTAKVVDTTT